MMELYLPIKEIQCIKGHTLRQREWDLYSGCNLLCEVCPVNLRKDKTK